MDELRRNREAVKNVIDFAEARMEVLKNRLSVPLLTERESDMVRGRIAELKNLINQVQSTGEADE